MKLNVALQIIMATMFNSSFTHGSDQVKSDRKLSSLEKVVGNGCRNKIDFNARFITKKGQACGSCKLCAGSHLNHLFTPAVKDICIECSEEDSSCTIFEVITSFAEAYKMGYTTLKAGIDSSSDPTKVVISGSNNLVDWVVLHDETIRFEDRDQTAEFVINNDEVFQHYSAQFHRVQDTMRVGQYGLVEAYTKSCTSQLHAGLTGQLIPYYTALSTTPSNAPSNQPSNPLGYKFNTKAELREAIGLWTFRDGIPKAIKQYGPIEEWDISSITDLSDLLINQHNFNEDLSAWNTSQVTNMSRMFYSSFKFNGNISKWTTSRVTNMNEMFRSAYAFNQDPSDWDVSGVTNMYAMFLSASKFDVNLSDWNISSVKDMRHMFNSATAFNQVLCWDTSQADTKTMFKNNEGKVDDSC